MNIFWPDTDDAPFIWSAADAQGGSAQSLEAVPVAAPVRIIIPGQWARILPLDLPKLRGAEQMAAAGFAVEDRLAAPLASQHLVIAPLGDRAGVIAKDKIRVISERVKAAGFTLEGLYVDYDVVPPGPAFKFSGRIIVPHSLTGGADGYAAEAALVENAAALSEISGISPDFGAAINFASGEFTAKKRGGLSAASLARFAAMALILGLSWTGLQIVRARAHNAQADYLQSQTRIVYTQITGAKAPANPALAVTRALKSGGAGQTDFMSLSAVLFSALQATPGAKIESLDYDAAKAQLRMRIIYPDLQIATQLERSVSAMGGNLSTGSLRKRGNDVMGDAILTAGGA